MSTSNAKNDNTVTTSKKVKKAATKVMPRIVDQKTLADIQRYLMNHGIAELHTKGLSEEEESTHLKKTFEEIAELGYEHIHTLKVIPADDGREPYFVHVDVDSIV